MVLIGSRVPGTVVYRNTQFDLIIIEHHISIISVTASFKENIWLGFRFLIYI